MEKEYVKSIISGDKYYSIDDLRYNRNVGIMFSREQLEDFLLTKNQLIEDNCGIIRPLPLKTFNSKHIFYVNGDYLSKSHEEYLRLISSDYALNNSWINCRNSEDIPVSKLYSEVEGTLRIENVPTTQKRIAEIDNSSNLTDNNDIIVKNMLNAIRFILDEKPAFNKENLYSLYNILTKDCLPEESRLKNGMLYRHDKVYIGAYEGAKPEIIDSCMDSLFEFANSKESLKEYGDYLPYICHYYILYIHPYFDYNGRTARMVSFWLNYINRIDYASYFMSEAINENKSNYYKALVNTRSTKNDLTYFLGYIMETAIKFSLVYRNLEAVKEYVMSQGNTMSSAELVYTKKILIHNPQGFFTQKLFVEYTGTDMSKQGALKMLNVLCDYGILEKSKNKKGESIFRFNQNLIKYINN